MPKLYTRNQGSKLRYYADLRDIGGSQFALKPHGSKRATADEAEALKLLADEVELTSPQEPVPPTVLVRPPPWRLGEGLGASGDLGKPAQGRIASGAGRLIGQRAVGSDGVVLPPPLFDEHLCLLQGIEDLALQHLFAERSVEALVVAILPRATLAR